MNINFEIIYKKNMLTLYGGSAFPNGIERQVSEESIYTYSDDDAAKFFEESDNESDNKSDNESDNKIAFENQLEEVKQNRDRKRFKVSKAAKEEELLEDLEEERIKKEYFKKLELINLNSNRSVGYSVVQVKPLLWFVTNNQRDRFNSDSSKTLIRGHYMTIEEFVDELIKLDGSIREEIINEIKQNVIKWRDGNEGIAKLRLDYNLTLAEERNKILLLKKTEEEILKKEEERIKEEFAEKEREAEKEKENISEYDNLKELLLKLNSFETRRDIGFYINVNNLNFGKIKHDIFRLGNTEELNNLLNQILKK
jgi:hypothetical protein